MSDTECNARHTPDITMHYISHQCRSDQSATVEHLARLFFVVQLYLLNFYIMVSQSFHIPSIQSKGKTSSLTISTEQPFHLVLNEIYIVTDRAGYVSGCD